MHEQSELNIFSSKHLLTYFFLSFSMINNLKKYRGEQNKSEQLLRWSPEKMIQQWKLQTMNLTI